VILGAIAAAFVWFGSSNGIGMSPDSMAYLEVARSVARGEGLTEDGEPLTRYPPLYPLMLSATGFVMDDLFVAARLLHCALYALLVVAVGWAIGLASDRSWVVMAAGMICVLAVAGVVELNLMAWSEPGFLLALVCFAAALSRWTIDHGAGWMAVWVVALAAAMMARYVGVTLLAPVLGASWLLWRKGLSRLAAVTVAAGGAATLPLMLWLVRNQAAAGSATQRVLAFHPPGPAAMREAVYTLTYWFFPAPILPVALRAVVAGVAIVAVIWMIVGGLVRIRRRRNSLDSRDALVFLLSVFVAGYLGFLALSRTFVDAHTRFDNRILSPVVISLLLFGSLMTVRGASDTGRPTVRGVAVLALLAVVLANLPWTADVLRRGRDEGFGYANRAWAESATLDQLRGLPPTASVFSNVPEVIRVFLDRPAKMIPMVQSPASGEPNLRFEDDVIRMGRILEQHQGVLVVFDQGRGRTYLPSADEIERTIPLTVLFEGSDGRVYGIGDDGPRTTSIR
jgi:hypothetical protein